MSNEQELNKKLAEWAGLVEVCPPEKDSYKRGLWADTKNIQVHFDLPDFANSLDTCFKWLVPKIKYFEIKGVNIQSVGSVTGTYYSAMVKKQEDSEPNYGHIMDNPALALCLAIEKLIEESK